MAYRCLTARPAGKVCAMRSFPGGRYGNERTVRGKSGMPHASPPAEPAPFIPPPDAGGPAPPPGGRSPRRRRPAGGRHARSTRVILVLVTAAVTAAALVIALRAESGKHSSAAATPTGAHPGKNPAGPSGVPMPTGDLPGWRLTYSTDFSGNSLPPGWSAYSGQPGSDPYGYWNPTNVTVSNGELHLRTTADDDPQRPNTYSTGGVGFYGDTQQYGMYLVRMKGDYEPGVQLSNIILLWPAQQGAWPPEIDFYEDEGGSRDGYTASLHPGPDGDDCCVIRHSRGNAGRQWHTYGVIWAPSSITYTIDGHPWAEVRRSDVSSPGSWPAMPMTLDLQSQNLGPAQPGGPIETMTVAWVAEYAPSS